MSQQRLHLIFIYQLLSWHQINVCYDVCTSMGKTNSLFIVQQHVIDTCGKNVNYMLHNIQGSCIEPERSIEKYGNRHDGR